MAPKRNLFTLDDQGRQPSVILLDLVMTLVANTYDRSNHWKRGQPYEAWIQREVYREWLVELLRDKTVVMITARAEKYRAATMARIEQVLGWTPAAAYFNELGLTPPQSKRRVMELHVIPVYGQPADTAYLALESNGATRAMYHAMRVAAVPVPTTAGSEWTQLPTV